jgi:DNA polymerase-3 subunit epsilon
LTGTPWHHGPLTAFDLESTGIDTREVRIVTGYVATVLSRADGRTVAVGADVLVNPGVPIPAGATEKHGITDDMVRARGVEPAGAINLIAEEIARSLKARIPVVGMNLAYDFTLLYWECLRWNVATVAERTGLPPAAMFGPIIDAYVLDKQVDPYRRGSRKLEDTARHYGVDLVNAHTADADAMAAARVAVAIADRHPRIAAMTLPDLHHAQKRWREEQAISLQRHLRVMKGQKDAVCDPCWPACTDPDHESG